MGTIAIVGAGPQLGRAIGRRFAVEGFDVALVARTPATLESIAQDLARHGTRVATFPADITDRPALCAALAAAEERFGAVDVLGFSPAPSLADLSRAPIVEATEVTVDSILAQLDLYLLGGVAAVQQVLPGMRARGEGTIMVTSGAGSGPLVIPQVANVQVATAGLRNWVLNLNAALAGSGVHAAHVALAVYIGQGRPGSEPDRIAELYWRVHTERAEAEIFYDDLPEGGVQGLSDAFVDPA